MLKNTVDLDSVTLCSWGQGPFGGGVHQTFRNVSTATLHQTKRAFLAYLPQQRLLQVVGDARFGGSLNTSFASSTLLPDLTLHSTHHLVYSQHRNLSSIRATNAAIFVLFDHGDFVFIGGFAQLITDQLVGLQTFLRNQSVESVVSTEEHFLLLTSTKALVKIGFGGVSYSTLDPHAG